ncbi:glyoxalase bleomycin resistance dioxygenase [Fusarium albosuccineum]|uniref:Glyoxalase bleomycin resistance dioxygenase n=1 Tax=Fusarium albosuccineum TaxID=1237068 RepID=A0A8H4PBG5_9HYPO|nr:glyoxalase bleomycin resistance dioxygenase [Fusarium albosuccineum]
MATTKSTSPVLPPIKLAHVVFKTANFTSMVAWYKAALGAHATYENPGMAFLTYDDEHHRVAIANIPGCRTSENPMMTAGMEHVAFTYPTLRDMVRAYQQRKARGIYPVWCVNHGTTTSMYYQDPDGNKIEIQVDAFDTVEDANAYFQSPAFAENPIGVDFDPEELARRAENGEDEKELLKRPNIGPRGIDTVPMPPKPEVRESYEPV